MVVVSVALAGVVTVRVAYFTGTRFLTVFDGVTTLVVSTVATVVVGAGGAGGKGWARPARSGRRRRARR